jgi:DNA-binding XRE family transcriptional regulator
MTHPRNAPPAGAGAEKAAFLRDLRALRDQAGLGPRDLAARAHFPEQTLTTAEAGPDLPSLPVLQAYVRGCGAGEAEWEDRWRRLNASDSGSQGPALPTRAPSSARQPTRVMADQDTVGLGLARVARGLVPLSPDPAGPSPEMGTRTPFGDAPAGNGGTRPSAEFSAYDNGTAGTGGWFDPAPKTSSPPASSYTPPPAAPPSPPVSPGAPTVQYPAVNGYQDSEYQAPERSYQPPPSTYSAPSYRLPEEFRTPVPPPADLTGPAGGAGGGGASAPAAPSGLGTNGPGARGFGSSGPGPGVTSPDAGSPTPAGGPVPSSPGAPGATAATPKPHAAPATSPRRTSGWMVAAVIVVLIIAAAIWLVLSH